MSHQKLYGSSSSSWATDGQCYGQAQQCLLHTYPHSLVTQCIRWSPWSWCPAFAGTKLNALLAMTQDLAQITRHQRSPRPSPTQPEIDLAPCASSSWAWPHCSIRPSSRLRGTCAPFTLFNVDEHLRLCKSFQTLSIFIFLLHYRA